MATVMLAIGAAGPVSAQQVLSGNLAVSGGQNGNRQGGYLVQGGYDLTLSGGTYYNFRTTGGAGSGGGAGLGGVAFAGSGSTVTVNNATVIGNTALGGTGGALSAVGGTLNGIGSSGVAGPGAGGITFNDNESLLGDGNGNGLAGTVGADAQTALGTGGTGGRGGNGQDGWGHNPQLILDVTNASIGAASVAAALAAKLTEGTAACVNPLTVGECPGNTAAAVQLALDVTQAGIALGQTTAKLDAWNSALTAGSVGNGGDGGAGGAGGAGSEGLGGGLGGDGGTGGGAGGGRAKAGVGGAGGTGGEGGFGAGGGRGGQGGAGSTLGDAGAGGVGGFGAGQGSTGTGNRQAASAGGGGGSGYGGAFFVQDGGTLHVTGNTMIGQNNVAGGASLNGGTAGDSAGSGIFVMTGGNVNLDPGRGRTITINDSIADDSQASVSGPVARGAGADVHIASGTVLLNGKNTYTGTTVIDGGTLVAQDGQGINRNSNIRLNGGVLQTSGTFDRFLGAESDRIQWTGNGGFASADSGTLNVNLQGGMRVTWAQDGFVPDGAALIFGSDTSVGNVLLKNGIDLNAGVRTVVVAPNADGKGYATISGVLSNGGLTVGDGSPGGRLILTAVNDYEDVTRVTAGATLVLVADGSIARSRVVTVDGLLDVSGAAGGTRLRTLDGRGEVRLGAHDLSVTEASTRFNGRITGTGGLNVEAGGLTLGAVNTYSGLTNIRAGALLRLADAGAIAQSAGVKVDGTFDIAASVAGSLIRGLSGQGRVVLGDRTLSISGSNAEFGGVVEGRGVVAITSGVQVLSGRNVHTGQTVVDEGATLVLAGRGSIGTSAQVLADGTLDISRTDAGAAIRTLAGRGAVSLGSHVLTITEGSTTFAGSLEGAGGLTVAGGRQALSGLNRQTGVTRIENGATLALIDQGRLAASEASVGGILDVSAAAAPSVRSLSGLGDVRLGDRTLVLTGADTAFAGTSSGTGGMTVTGGRQEIASAQGFTGVAGIEAGAALALTGRGAVETASSVRADGTFDIGATDAGARIRTLEGAGRVELGDRTLTVTTGRTTFAGGLHGTGGLTVEGGTQSLSGSSSFTGEARVAGDATLALTGRGSVEQAAAVRADGLFDIGATEDGARIRTLTGQGVANLGDRTLSVTAGSTDFAGDIRGPGNVVVVGGQQTLSGANSYEGVTRVNEGAGLSLTGRGAVEASSILSIDGNLDIGATEAGARVRTLAGQGTVDLGARTLTLTAASDRFDGVLRGTGGLNVEAGHAVLAGVNTYEGATRVNDGAVLSLDAAGSVSRSVAVSVDGLLDLSAGRATHEMRSLAGGGGVLLGDNRLGLTDGSTTFGGIVAGRGSIDVTGGRQGLSGVNAFTGDVRIASGAALALLGQGSVEASGGVVNNGVFDIAGTEAGARVRTLVGDGQVELGSRTLTVTQARGTFAGAFAGAGSVAVTGGVQELTGASTHTGGTLVQNATLSVTSDAALGAGEGALSLNNARLTTPQGLTSSRDVRLIGANVLDTVRSQVALAGTVSGAGGLIVAGGGALSLTGANTYTGGTRVVENTTLAVGTDAALGAPEGALVVESGKLLATGDFSTERTIIIREGGVLQTNGHAVALKGQIIVPTTTTVTGAVRLFAGGVKVDGPMTVDASTLVIESGSALMGTGAVSLATRVDGVLAPGNSPGVLAFAAPITLGAGSAYEADIDGPTAGTGAGHHDAVVVTGEGNTFTAGGTLRVRLRGITGDATNTYTPRIGTGFRVVEAQGGVLGSFATLARPAEGLPSNTRLDALYNPNNVTLWVTPADYTNLSTPGVNYTRNQAQVAGVVQSLRPASEARTSADFTRELGVLYSRDVSALPGVMSRLGGTVYGDALVTAAGNARAFGDGVLAAGSDRTGAMATDGRVTSWLSGFGLNSRVGADGNTAYHASGGGVAAGTDVRLGAGFRIGAALGHGGSSVTSRDTGSSAQVDTTHLAAYGVWEQGRWSVNGQAGVNFQEERVRRNLGAFGHEARGRASGTGFSGGTEATSAWSAGGFNIRPALGVRADTASRGGLTETGASVLSLRVDEGDLTSVRATAGVSADRTFALAQNWSFTPSLRVRYSHELADDGTVTGAAFTRNSAAGFAQVSARPGRSGGDVRVGFDLRMPGNVSVFTAYTAEARGNLSGQAVTGGLRYAW